VSSSPSPPPASRWPTPHICSLGRTRKQRKRKRLPAKPLRPSAPTKLGTISSTATPVSSKDNPLDRGAVPRFRALAEGQYPHAVIVGCADSRVAPEILFDVGVGDIFVVRIAGNVVGGAGVTVKGSIEYAIAELNVPLIVVLGHSGCGAVKAAMKHIDAKDSLPGAINGLVELIKPAVAQSHGKPGDPLDNAVRKNVELGVERLKQLQPIVAPQVKEGKLKVVGAVYDLRTGTVTEL
jgi:carbonic anhydrase